MIIGAMQLADVDEVQELVSHSFETSRRPYMTSVQPGAARFLEAFLQHPSLSPDRRYRVARSKAGALLAYADFRLIGEKASFLSNITVAPEARGRGVATALLDDFLNVHPSVESMELDVFSDNAAARKLYEKRGFRASHSVEWWIRNPPSIHPLPENWSLKNAPDAAAWLRTFGFCEFSVDTRTEVRRFGQIGHGTLRCFSVEDFRDNRFLSYAANLVPMVENVLYIGPSDAGKPIEDCKSVNTSLRMIARHAQAGRSA